jgi:hypothetical protein
MHARFSKQAPPAAAVPYVRVPQCGRRRLGWRLPSDDGALRLLRSPVAVARACVTTDHRARLD